METNEEGGVTPGSAAAEADFVGTAMYLRRLAALLGEELGLDGLGDVYVIGEQRRLVLARRADGSLVHARTDARVDPRTLLHAIHEEG